MIKKILIHIILFSSLYSYEYLDSKVYEEKGNLAIDLYFCTNNLSLEKDFIIEHLNNQVDTLEQQQSKSEVYQYRGKQYVFNKGKKTKYDKPIITIIHTNNNCYKATALYKVQHDDIKTSVSNNYESYFNGFITKNTATKNQVKHEIRNGLENEIKENIIIQVKQNKDKHETYVEIPEYLYNQTKDDYYINMVCTVTNVDDEFLYNFQIKNYKKPLRFKDKMWNELTPYFNTDCEIELIGK